MKQNRVAMSEFKITNMRNTFATKGEIDFVDLTDMVRSAVAKSGIKNGIVHVFAPHATGILILTENDYPLLKDIELFIENLIPRNENYNHPSNAHAHLRSMMLPPDKTLPIINGVVEFGTWQSLLFVETDVYPRKRTIIIQVMGET
jgi:secondary thiamine-phosphate synthase enzyme